jgi:hypothetical protein
MKEKLGNIRETTLQWSIYSVEQLGNISDLEEILEEYNPPLDALSPNEYERRTMCKCVLNSVDHYINLIFRFFQR